MQEFEKLQVFFNLHIPQKHELNAVFFEKFHALIIVDFLSDILFQKVYDF